MNQEPEKKTNYKITIEGGQFTPPLVLEYDHVSLKEEVGIEMVYKRGENSYGLPADMRRNGHRRAYLLMWGGCADYESFVDRSEKYE